MIPKICYILILTIVFISCDKQKIPTVPDSPTNSDNSHSGQGDVEIIDSISLEIGDTTSCDTIVNPDVILVSRWPVQYEVWDNHFVLFVDSISPKVASLTLLSLKDWNKILSANSEQKNQANDTASHYVEYELDGWEIPSEKQAKRIRTEISPNEMNQHLAEIYADTMHVKDGSSNARYLCEKATKSFSLVENTKISTAGSKTKYHLRLVKEQRVERL